MKKQLLIIPFTIFLLLLLIFFYLLTIERNPSELTSNLLNKSVPKFEAESLLKNENFTTALIIKTKNTQRLVEKTSSPILFLSCSRKKAKRFTQPFLVRSTEDFFTLHFRKGYFQRALQKDVFS